MRKPAESHHSRHNPPSAGSTRTTTPDEHLVRVLARRRAVLLGSYWFALGREDLEDALAQATLEVLLAARRRWLLDERHLANVLEQKFRCRIIDRRRALQGRSPMERALATSVRLRPGGAWPAAVVDLVDERSDVEARVVAIDELWRIARAARRCLSPDQRAVIAHQAGGGRAGEFTDRHVWSAEKYRKVGQRGRARLRRALVA